MVRKRWDAQIAKLALASVLIDTADLAAEGKVEAADREAVQYLNAKIQSSPRDARTWDRKQFYKEINDAKTNIDGLEFNEILRKDYKEWTQNGTKLGISSVVKPFEFLTAKAQQSSSSRHTTTDAFDQAIDSFMRSKSLSIFAIMTAFTSPDQTFRRELFLQATNASSAAAVSRFSKSAGEELGLADLHVPGISSSGGGDGSSPDGEEESKMTRKVWVQKNVAKSRKQVAPLLRAAI